MGSVLVKRSLGLAFVLVTDVEEISFEASFIMFPAATAALAATEGGEGGG